MIHEGQAGKCQNLLSFEGHGLATGGSLRYHKDGGMNTI